MYTYTHQKDIYSKTCTLTVLIQSPKFSVSDDEILTFLVSQSF